MKSYQQFSFLIAPVSVALFLFLSTSMAADWPTFRGTLQRTGFSSQIGGVPESQPLWQFGPVGAIVCSPSVADGIVYFGSRDSTIYALDILSGNVIWKQKCDGWIDATPVVAGDSLFVASRGEITYVYNRKNGALLRTIITGPQIASPVVLADGSLLTTVGYPYNRLFKFGKSEAESWGLQFTQPMYSTPAIQNNKAVLGGNDGILYCVNLTTRAIDWSLQTRGTTYVSTPSIDDSLVYFAPGDYDRSVYAVDLSNGAIQWTSTGAIAVAKQRNALSLAQQMSRTDLINFIHMAPEQRKAWILYHQPFGISLLSSLSKKSTANSDSGFIPLDNNVRTSSVAVDTSHVYVVQRELGYSDDIDLSSRSRFTIFAFDKHTGKEAWSFSDFRNSVLLGYNSSPVITGNKVFAGWGEGQVYCFDAASGKVLWQDTLQGNIIASPAIAQRKLLVATMSGYLYAYSLGRTAPGENFQKSTFCYPNPARGQSCAIQVFVQKNATISVTLYTMAEKPIVKFTQRATPSNAVDGQKITIPWYLNKVANGAYFASVKVQYDEGGTDSKLLKIAILR